ncbi:hypothetical protein ACHSBP_09630 [Pseudoalteromonas sp. XMcav1-K]|uniref:hypothetical protein n=1 Tax=Pseudoalteromonas sp. XMcav1-K TaxID=3374372 RepID=UPI003756FB2A
MKLTLYKLVNDFYLKLRDSARDPFKSLMFISEDFPVMDCYNSCYLMALHIFKNTKYTSIELVVGYISGRDENEMIGHCWLEVDGTLIDLTSEQYNTLCEEELSSDIVDRRPFLQTYCIDINLAPHYDLFSDLKRQFIDPNFSQLSRSGFEEWKEEYFKIMG